MTDDTDIPRDDAVPDEPAGPLGGERLAEARRELQISVHEIAKELHLDEPKVRALERNDFEVLGAPVFAKGHLKTYAQLVNVDAADVLADYYHLNRSAAAEPVISTRPKPRRELTPGPWIAVIVVIVVVVSAYWWFSRDVASETGADAPTEQSDSITVEPPATGDEISTESQDGNEPIATESPDTELPEMDEPEPAAETPVESVPPMDDGQLHLLVTYTGDCWTEITDASGRRLLFDLGKDGRTVELTGTEPFNVLFGNPGNVSLRVNGEDYVLPSTNRPDRPMRLTISGS